MTNNTNLTFYYPLTVKILFGAGFGDEAAVGGEGVGAGEEAYVAVVVVEDDEVVAVGELELLDDELGGVAEMDDVEVGIGLHEVGDLVAVVELG